MSHGLPRRRVKTDLAVRRSKGRLEKFREVRDKIEAKILRWLEHPEEELARLKAERERERQQRLRAGYEEAEIRRSFVASDPRTELDTVLVGTA
jgi:hypothetical protein